MGYLQPSARNCEMFGKRLSLSRNAAMAGAQVVVSGVVLFLLYRYLLAVLGSESVGLWSLVGAAASVSKIGELGLSGTAVKFVAKYVARDEKQVAADVVQTVLLTVACVQGAVLLGVYPLVSWGLEVVVPGARLGEAFAILPYVLTAVWIAALAGVSLSALDGCERIDLRALVTMLSSVLFLLLAWQLVPHWGVAGLVWAQIGQWGATLVGGWLLLRRELPSLPWSACRWSRSRFGEMFGYAVKFQVTSICWMLVDPIVKGMMAKFGGLSSTAYFEMASRMVGQFRAVLMAAMQALVPRIAALHETTPKDVREAYLDSYRMVFFLSLPLYAGLVAAAPLAAELWIGRYEPDFIGYVAAVSLAFWINTLSGPAYFANLGTGRLGWNTAAAVSVPSLCAAGSYAAGPMAGSLAVAYSYAVGMAASSGLVLWGYHRDHGLPLTGLLPRENVSPALACLFGLIVGGMVFRSLDESGGRWLSATAGFSTWLAMSIPAFLRHPLLGDIRRRSGVVDF